MTIERPLNVRVAEALGWRDLRHARQGWIGVAPGVPICSEPIPPFGEESPAGWACTGPLIARFGLSIYARRREAGVLFEAAHPKTMPVDRLCPSASEAVGEWVALHGRDQR